MLSYATGVVLASAFEKYKNGKVRHCCFRFCCRLGDCRLRMCSRSYFVFQRIFVYLISPIPYHFRFLADCCLYVRLFIHVSGQSDWHLVKNARMFRESILFINSLFLFRFAPRHPFCRWPLDQWQAFLIVFIDC